MTIAYLISCLLKIRHARVKAKAAVLTLLSPPDTARIFAVMDQLTCQTTSLNLCSNFGDHEFPEASSHVQINTLPSYKSKQTELVGPLVTTQKKQPWLLLELHFQITALTWTLDVFTFLLLLSLKARQEYSSLMRKTTYKRWLANSTEKLPKYIYISWNFFHRMRFCFPVTWQQVSSLPSSLLAIKKNQNIYRIMSSKNTTVNMKVEDIRAD